MTQHRYLRDSAVPGDTYSYSASDSSSVEPGKHCGYNQTRERFLSADIDAADFTLSSLDARLPALASNSATALWLVPFRGISPTSVRVPVDLIYLDLRCTVLDAVESFPLAQVSPSSAPSATVLVLPSGTIRATETRSGDQLILCPPEEMKRQLQQLAEAKSQAVASSESAARTGSGRLLQWDGHARSRDSAEQASAVEDFRPEPAGEPALSAPQPQSAGGVEPPRKKNWLQRLLAVEPPDARKAPRHSLQGLAAYFFTGGTPVAHSVRDVSLSGMYVLTTERWYLGTMVRITLTDRQEPTLDRSITLNATVVRWGNDGVGLRFILQNGKSRRADSVSVGPDETQVDQFLQRIRTA
jgi:uncharacterized protein